MKKNILAFCLFIILIATVNASNKDAFATASEVIWKENNSFPSYVNFGEESVVTEESFFNYLQTELELNSSFSFELKSETPDELGFVHKRFGLRVNSIKVAYSNLMLHVKNGKVISFNGNVRIDDEPSESPTVSEKAALKSALSFVNAEKYQWQIEGNGTNFKSEFYPTAELLYLPNYSEHSTKYELVYGFNIYASKPLSRQMVYVNANTGKISFHESLIHSGGTSNGTAVTGYSDTQNIVTDSFSQAFRLRDSTRGNGVLTFNCQRQANYSSSIDFIDSNNYWNNANPNLDQYAGDAHWGTEVTYDYFMQVHNRNSIDNMGFALLTFMHYDQNYVNAFWNGQFMTYGDGNNLNGPLTTLDIVGHEITHGLTDFTSDLIYANESGALNESFSDIFGAAIEFTARPGRANWTIGEDIGGAFRNMSNPKANGDPDTYDGANWINQNCIPTSGNDQCGVHTNSGVQNYWFYLLVNGGVGVNDVADSFNVTGLGLNKAEKIAFRNLTVYLSPSSDYDDARFYSIQSAIDLYGACSAEVEATTNAWYAVGVGDEYVNAVTADFTAIEDTAFCTQPALVNFKVEGSNIQAFSWDFGNGQTSTNRAASTIYQNTGMYTVEFIADGGTCGSDTVTKVNYITVDPANVPCSYLISDTNSRILTNCSGRLYDSGGFGGNYEVDKSYISTISVQSADYIQLLFSSINMEAGVGFTCTKDYVEVYDGSSINAPLIGRYCENYPPPNNLINSTTNSVTIRFYSDRAIADRGFLINWNCMSAAVAPVAEFSSNTDSTCTGEIAFTNESLNGVASSIWNFGDGTTSSIDHPTHAYTTNGTFDVTLTVTNSLGTNSVSKTNKIIVNKLASPAVSNDTFCMGDDAGLKVFTNNDVVWYRDTLDNSFYSGDSLTLFNIQKDTNFYIKEVSSPQVFTGAKNNNAGPGNYSNDNDYLTFDVHKPILLKNMILFSNRAGVRRLDIWNSAGKLVNSQEVYVPGSPLRVTINMKLYPDSNLRMAFSDREISLFKNTSGAVYPYDISNLVSITGSNNAGEYPYFYRWQVSELPCESNLKEIKATIDTTCTLVGVGEQSINSTLFSISPNPTRGDIDIKFTADFSESSNVKLFDSSGKLMLENIYQSTRASLNIDYLPQGIYFINITTGNNSLTKKIVKIE